MEKNKNMFLSSAKELKSVPALAMCAMFAALALILNSVASINLVRISKSDFPVFQTRLLTICLVPLPEAYLQEFWIL